MKKFLTYMLGFCLIVPAIFVFSACKDEEPKMETWDGTTLEVSEAVEGVVTIETAEELAGLADAVNAGNTYEGVTIKLTCDIDLANKEWTPIGYGSTNFAGEILASEGALFKGKFDGQNYTINNLKITTFNRGGLGEDASAAVGLFGNIFKAEVKNLKIDDAKVVGNHRVGALVGYSIDSNIENCHIEDAEINCVYANNDESGDKAGAVVGFFAKAHFSDSAASISNCSAEDCEVKADRDAGQIVGTLWNGASYSDLTADYVIVSCNNSSSHIENYTKSGENISNNVIGRTS